MKAAQASVWLKYACDDNACSAGLACGCRDILAIPETRADWWAFFDRHLKQRLDDGSLKLSLIKSDHVQGN